MPHKLQSKLKQRDFYCVSCRKRVSVPADEMGVQTFKNKKVKGGVPALRSECPKCGTNVTKFIKKKDKSKMTQKFGKF